jgi:hypothetical protein
LVAEETRRNGGPGDYNRSQSIRLPGQKRQIIDLDQRRFAFIGGIIHDAQSIFREFEMYIITRSSFSSVVAPLARYGAFGATIPACLLSAAMLISPIHYNVAQAKSRSAVALACGKELQKQCTGVPAQANNMLECLEKAQVSRRCHALAHHIVRTCERDAVQRCQGVVAGQGNILGCLTTAKGTVSPQCNAALDAAYLR